MFAGPSKPSLAVISRGARLVTVWPVRPPGPLPSSRVTISPRVAILREVAALAVHGAGIGARHVDPEVLITRKRQRRGLRHRQHETGCQGLSAGLWPTSQTLPRGQLTAQLGCGCRATDRTRSP